MKPAARDYAKAFYQLAGQTQPLDKSLVKQFFASLKANRDLPLLPLILKELERIASEESGEVILDLILAKPITEEEGQSLVSSLENTGPKKRSIVLRTSVDPAIIGGAIIRVGDRTIDHSFKTKLTMLKEQ